MNTSLKIFRVALIVFIVIYLLTLLYFILAAFNGSYAPEILYRNSVFGSSLKTNFYIYFAVSSLIDILLIYTLIQLLIITDHFKDQSFFSTQILKLQKRTGKSFIIIAIVGFSASLFYHYVFSEYSLERLFFPFLYHFMVLIIGLGILVIKDVQKRALILQSENDLTI